MGVRLVGAVAVALVVAACSSGTSPGDDQPHRSITQVAPTTPTPTDPVGRAAAGHIVVVVMENKAYSAVVGNPHAPYLAELARQGMSYTSMHAIRHPSQPNYIALFSGSTRGVSDDTCPQRLTGPNLAQQLRKAGLTFTAYSEALPAEGNKACSVGAYARKHAPWTNFAALPASVSQPLSAFPGDYAQLPTVSWVIPDLDHDMHDGSIAQADTWARTHLSDYVTWARTHHSLLIITWDEDDHSESNRIPTFVVGAGVTARQVGTPVNLYSLLGAMEAHFALPQLGGAASAPSLALP